MACATLALVTAGPLAAFAAPLADAVQLHDGLAAEFRRPTVLVYPALDQRLLGGQPSPEARALFEQTIALLQGYANLKILVPDQTLGRMRQRRGWPEREQFAKSKAAEGIEDYKQVQLDAAVKHLREAAELFAQLEYGAVDARAVAQVELTRGLALLEQGERVDANLAFTRALQIDPRLRLNEKYDRPESVAAFEQARLALLANPQPPAEFDRWPEGEAAARDLYLLRARFVPAQDADGPALGEARPERLEVALLGPGGTVTQDAQPVGAPDAANRLAARLWAALPFGQGPRQKAADAEMRLDAGFAWFLYTQNDIGTDVFNNVGAQTAFTFSMARHIGMQVAFLIANSGRDREEDLRAEILTFRGFAGPGYESRVGRWRFDAHLGLEIASPGPIVTTDYKACKFATPDPDNKAYLACPSGEPSETPRTVVGGIGLTAGASFDLVDDIFLALDAWGAEYFFKVDETDLGRPVGGSLSLGYRFR